MLRAFKIILLVLMLIFSNIYLSFGNKEVKKINKDLDLKLDKKLRLESVYESHGGFHGDGVSIVKGKISQEEISRLVEKSQGKLIETPMDRDIKTLIFGGRRKDINYVGLDLLEDYDIGEVKNGYYVFLDRFKDKGTYNKGDKIFENGRSMNNYSLLMLDEDRGEIYYLKYDS